MQLQETERFRTFDVGSFVSYQTDEDITPTEAELVEEIPQHLMPVGPSDEEIAAKAAKPRRGKAYLRTEIDESPKPDAKTDKAQSDADDFGAGIDDESSPEDSPKPVAAKRASDQRSGSSQAAMAADSDNPGRKRKRRRRKRGSGRRETDSAGSDGQSNSDSDVPSATAVESVNDAAVNATTENVNEANQPSPGGATASSDSPRTGKKRRRRRRRRGGNSSENTDGRNTDGLGQPPAEAGS